MLDLSDVVNTFNSFSLSIAFPGPKMTVNWINYRKHSFRSLETILNSQFHKEHLLIIETCQIHLKGAFTECRLIFVGRCGLFVELKWKTRRCEVLLTNLGKLYGSLLLKYYYFELRITQRYVL